MFIYIFVCWLFDMIKMIVHHMFEIMVHGCVYIHSSTYLQLSDKVCDLIVQRWFWKVLLGFKNKNMHLFNFDGGIKLACVWRLWRCCVHNDPVSALIMLIFIPMKLYINWPRNVVFYCGKINALCQILQAWVWVSQNQYFLWLGPI